MQELTNSSVVTPPTKEMSYDYQSLLVRPFTQAILIFLSFIVHGFIREFIMSKPEGSVTVVAKIHIHCSYALQSFTNAIALVEMLRTVFGFLPLIVLILSTYTNLILWSVINCFFGYAAMIKIGFLVNIGQLPTR